jgi:ribonuclease HI
LAEVHTRVHPSKSLLPHVAASAVLRAWKGDNDASLFDKLGEDLSHQEGEWPSASAAMDSLLGNRLADTTISGESKLLNDALNCNIDWEWRHRDVEGVDQVASPDGIPHAWQDWMERPQKTRASVEYREESFQERGSAPSRWQLLASYTEKGQLPPPQLLADSDHNLKHYNPSQYMEVFQSRPDQGGGFDRKTLASAAKHVDGEPQEARRAIDVKKYDPRPVMELRHQVGTLRSLCLTVRLLHCPL